MNKISCDICRDLIPLVKDGIASPDSQRAVKNHIQSCRACQVFFEPDSQGLAETNLNDQKNWQKIKSRLNRLLLGIIALSILFGAGLSMDQNMFYNILLMPMIGGGGYLLLKKKVYWLVLAVFGITFTWNVIIHFADYQDTHFGHTVMSFVYFSMIYTFLCMLGVVIAGLLNFAFKKEEK